MSEPSCHRAVKKFLNRLERSGLIQRLELSDEDIADAIWLALHVTTGETKTEQSQQTTSDSVVIENREPIEPINNLPPPSIDIYPQESTTKESDTQTTNKGLPLQVPTAAALQNKLPISRALRPLMRKVDSQIRKILDIEATVNRIVEEDIWIPVTKPEPERWLTLELVVEASRSSFIWEETIDELRKLLQNHGAFRTVRVWRLSSIVDNQNIDNQNNPDNYRLQLTRYRKGSQKTHYQHSHRELIPSNKRTAIALVSDCVSSIWQQGKIHKWLQEWSNKTPTAIIQLFPERLWQSSELGLGEKLSFSAFKPGAANSDLVIPYGWEELEGKNILKLPVVTLEALSIKNWARVIAGFGSTTTPGFAFDLEFVAAQAKKEQVKEEQVKKEQIKKENEETNKAKETSETKPEQSKIEAIRTSDIKIENPENLVDKFLATASPTAQKLAGFMAAVPVDLRIVHIIQKKLLPQPASPVPVAEVFLSGMIQRVEHSQKYSQKHSQTNQNPQYDFVPEVRKILNQAMRLDETENVLDIVSTYIAEHLGLSINSFTALLLRHQDLSLEQQNQILPFARVAVEVLQNLGGDYATFAEQLEARNPDFSNTTASNKRFDKFPPLQTCNFEIANILVEDGENIEEGEQESENKLETTPAINLQVFEFEIASIEVKKSGLFQRQTKLIINRRRQQAYGFIEYLENKGNEIALEMVQISGGIFMMGAPETEEGSIDSERPQHEVTVSTFFMGKYPVTQAQWKFVASLPQVNRELKPEPSRFKGENRPVECVSWFDAVEFCLRLTQYTKRPYRLPSESEWEYACRAGTTTPFHFGETITTDLANYRGTDNEEYKWSGSYGRGPKGIYREETTVVGNFGVANAFGLYDMHGNVWEWCADEWHENYEGAPTDGSAWIEDNSNDNRSRLLRGGSWFFDPVYCRSALRYYINPDYDGSHFGFRVVCGVFSSRTLPSP